MMQRIGQWLNQTVSKLKVALFVVSVIPFGRLIWGVVNDQLGANPVEFITRNTGDWALYFLCICLSITPLRKFTNWNALIKFRRMLGLFTFFYASLHLLCFLVFDHYFNLAEMLKDVLKRPFIFVGMMAWLGLLPLALTSTQGMMRRLGGKRWQVLHRIIYLIAILSILHFYWMKAGKSDFNQPILFAAIVFVLLGLRAYWKWR